MRTKSRAYWFGRLDSAQEELDTEIALLAINEKKQEIIQPCKDSIHRTIKRVLLGNLPKTIRLRGGQSVIGYLTAPYIEFYYIIVSTAAGWLTINRLKPEMHGGAKDWSDFLEMLENTAKTMALAAEADLEKYGEVYCTAYWDADIEGKNEG